MVAITTNLYTWMMKQFVLTELYHGDGRQGEMICDRLIPSFSGDTPLREDFLFMKGMCVIQQALSTGNTPGFDVIRPMVALATLDKQSWKWMVCILLSSIRITQADKYSSEKVSSYKNFRQLCPIFVSLLRTLLPRI